MISRLIFKLIAFSFLLYSCRDNKSNHINFGVSIKSVQMRGGLFVDSKGQQNDFRILKVNLTNDTTVPINLQMHFPQGCYYFYPIPNYAFKVFLLPDSLTGQNQYNFITELDSCMNKDTISSIPSIILPKQSCIINFGTLSEKMFVGATYSLQTNDANSQDIILKINGVSVLVGRLSYAKHN